MTETIGGPPPGRVDVAELVRIANDALTEAILARVRGRGPEPADVLGEADRAGLKRALPALAQLVDNGDLDRLVRLARLYGSAEDALSDDIVARLADTAAEGLDLLDRANRSGVTRALPALASLVDNGDLERLVRLARLYGSAEDALSDDIVARLADTATEGLDLLDQANRSGVKRALPALASLVDNGDLERLVRLARLYGSAEDALSDDIVARLAELAGDGLSLLDRVNRSGIARFLDTFEALRDNGGLDRLFDVFGRLADRLDQLEALLAAVDRAAAETVNGRPARGGIGGLLGLVRPAENQEAIRYLINIGKALEKQALDNPGGPPDGRGGR